MSAYCAYRKLSPQEVVSEFQLDKKKGQDSLEDYLRALKASGKSPATVKAALSAIKSWLSLFELQVTRKIKLNGVGSAPTLKGERVPTRAELEKTLNCGDVRTRAVISFIAGAGLRYESMAGLTLRDLPELDITTGKALRTPMRVNVGAEISKNRKPFFTFLAEPKYLEAYLAERMAWDKLTPDRPVFVAARTFASHGSYVRKGDPMTSGGLSMEVRRAMRLAGLKQRPYVWRSFFDTSLLNARVDKDIQSFCMGHSGTIEATYTLRKNLSEDQVESMRDEAAKAFKEAPAVSVEQHRDLEGRVQVLTASKAELDAELKAQIEGLNQQVMENELKLRSVTAGYEQFRLLTSTYVGVLQKARGIFGEKRVDKLLFSVIKEQDERDRKRRAPADPT